MNSGKQVLSNEPSRRKSLRLWPGIVIVMLQWLIRFGIPIIVPSDGALMIAVYGGLLGGLAIALWWAFFSGALQSERWGAIVLMIVALVATSYIIDKSIATANMGMMFIIYSIPVMSLAFVVWAVASSRLSNRLRRATMVVTILLASGFWAFLRTNGMTSDLHHDFSWRWAKTQEKRFMAKSGNEPMALPAASETGANWPGFRGPNRDGIIHGTKINTDWKALPPNELWRRSIGPGCSSFASNAGLLYTQEQRGEDEVVTCYDLTTGKPVWIHHNKTRFEDSHAGAGPRATPTYSEGFIYTLGATGILNALNAGNGTVILARQALLPPTALYFGNTSGRSWIASCSQP